LQRVTREFFYVELALVLKSQRKQITLLI